MLYINNCIIFAGCFGRQVWWLAWTIILHGWRYWRSGTEGRETFQALLGKFFLRAWFRTFKISHFVKVFHNWSSNHDSMKRNKFEKTLFGGNSLYKKGFKKFLLQEGFCMGSYMHCVEEMSCYYIKKLSGGRIIISVLAVAAAVDGIIYCHFYIICFLEPSNLIIFILHCTCVR